MGIVVNISGRQVDAVTIQKARQYFPGRGGNEIMDHRSFLQKIYRGGIPRDMYTKVNGNYYFDANYLKGNYKDAAA